MFWSNIHSYFQSGRVIPKYEPTPEPVQEAPKNTKCHECNIELSVPGSYYCDVCSSMYLAVATPFFQLAHQEWEEENERRIQYKRTL